MQEAMVSTRMRPWISRSKEACAYITDEWDPPAVSNATNRTAVLGSSANVGSTSNGPENRTRKPMEFYDPGEFWRRELTAIAAQREAAPERMDAEVALQMAELERALVEKLQAAVEAHCHALPSIQWVLS